MQQEYGDDCHPLQRIDRCNVPSWYYCVVQYAGLPFIETFAANFDLESYNVPVRFKRPKQFPGDPVKRFRFHGHYSGTKKKFERSAVLADDRQIAGTPETIMEPASGIEPPTC